MKKLSKFQIICLVVCALAFLSTLTAKIIIYNHNTFNNKELTQLKENFSVYCEEAHAKVINYEAYADAVLLERVIEYTHMYDDERWDWGHIYSKYQLPDGSVIYLESVLMEMNETGNLYDDYSPTGPYEIWIDYYNAQKDLATTGTSTYYGGTNDPLELKEVSDGVYAYIKEASVTYYFIMN